MGITQRLGTIPLAIQTDASNNVGIGAAPSGSYKLEVTGTGRFTGGITAQTGEFLSAGQDGSTGSVVRIGTTNTNAAARNWGIVNSWDNFGDLTFRVSNAQGGNALSAGSTKMVILSSGNVGIGTTSPDTIASQLSTLSLGGTNSTISGGISYQINGSVKMYQYVDNDSLFTHQALSGIGQKFLTSNTERMRITSGGQVAIGRTDGGGGRLGVRGATSGGGANAFYVDNSSSAELLSVRDDGALGTGTASSAPYNLIRSGRVMMVDSGGVVGYQSSTKESKTNINNLTNVSFLYQLNPVSFNYRKTEEISNTFTDEFNEDLHYGLIADEVEKVNKELVFYNEKDGVKELAGVEYGKLTAVLIKAIQELNERLNKAGL
jgi:hypothetical protein